MGGGHAYRCCAPGQHSNHDDNHNDDDDSEECCLTERLTPNSLLESYNCPHPTPPSMTMMRGVCMLLSVNHNFPLICKASVKLHAAYRGLLYEVFMFCVCSGAFDVAL